MEKINFNILFRRILAYLVDMAILFLLWALISIIPVFNIYSKESKDLYQEFNEVLNEYVKTVKTLNDNFKDKEITQEEYDNLILFDSYKEILEDRYDDQIISNKEYEIILNDIEASYISKAEDFEYENTKLSVKSTIITLMGILGYFGVLQYFLKGKTLGKMIFKLKVVNVKDKANSLVSYILRSGIVNNIFFIGLNVLCLFLLSKDGYFKISNYIDMLINIVEASIIFLIITREDGRGLHDLICNTQVVDDKKIIDNKNGKNIVIEGKYKEN